MRHCDIVVRLPDFSPYGDDDIEGCFSGTEEPYEVKTYRFSY